MNADTSLRALEICEWLKRWQKKMSQHKMMLIENAIINTPELNQYASSFVAKGVETSFVKWYM